ncbi:MAG: HPr family phosphocarrier protein [Gammaproteobacteria bacterium]|nr:HPr family phosphocarrier protein [Gammaproteobacteria bacterium]
MVKSQVTIINKLGLHARAAAKFVNTASKFSADVQLTRNNRTVNGKSIMGVMLLAASQGTELQLEISGEDEQAALAAIIALIENRFGEGE